MIDFENNTSLDIDISLLEKISLSLTKKDIELIIVNNDEIQELNKEHRNIDKATDVLSFPLDFEMENMPFGVQLEIYEFEKLSENTSRLKQNVIYQSVNHRDQNLKLPFKQGINWAHNRLEEILTKSK